MALQLIIVTTGPTAENILSVEPWLNFNHEIHSVHLQKYTLSLVYTFYTKFVMLGNKTLNRCNMHRSINHVDWFCFLSRKSQLCFYVDFCSYVKSVLVVFCLWRWAEACENRAASALTSQAWGQCLSRQRLKFMCLGFIGMTDNTTSALPNHLQLISIMNNKRCKNKVFCLKDCLSMSLSTRWRFMCVYEMCGRETQVWNTAVCEGVAAVAVSVVPSLSVHVGSESRRRAATPLHSRGSSYQPPNPLP